MQGPKEVEQGFGVHYTITSTIVADRNCSPSGFYTVTFIRLAGNSMQTLGEYADRNTQNKVLCVDVDMLHKITPN